MLMVFACIFFSLLGLFGLTLLFQIKKFLKKTSSLSESHFKTFEHLKTEQQEIKFHQKEMKDSLKQDFVLLRQDQGSQSNAYKEEQEKNARHLREEIGTQMRGYNQSMEQSLYHLQNSQKEQFSAFEKRSSDLFQKQSQNQEQLRTVLERHLGELIQKNQMKLDEMRQTVDEKLQGVLEKRLHQSFTQVSERLEQVHRGLGEMQSLTHNVGDLKRLLSNVKTRGIWGEYQLGNILEEILSPEQYEKEVEIKKGSGKRVDYAVKLPGQDELEGSFVFLPIDSKFPQEDYQKILALREDSSSSPSLQNKADKKIQDQLRLLIQREARSIKEKYISPPKTTSFAVMFLPTESLYAEVLRLPGLIESLQQKHFIILSGPTILSALLNSLNVGFKTLAIQKRTSEIWSLLKGIRTEFQSFTHLLEKTQEKLQRASEEMEKAARKSKKIGKKLDGVESLPSPSSKNLSLSEPSREKDLTK